MTTTLERALQLGDNTTFDFSICLSPTYSASELGKALTNILTLTCHLAHHLRAIDKEEECARLVRNSTRHEGFCPYPENRT
jgi:hypothetical protein